MIKFDSDEYWLNTTWDRFGELEQVPLSVRNEFLHQEELTLRAIERRLLKSGPTSAPLHLVDLGCGTGRIAKLILDRFPQQLFTTLVDANPRTLELTRHNLQEYRNTNFVLGSVYDVNEIVKEKADIVICLEVFHHISNIPDLLECISRVLRNDGVLIGNVFTEERYKQWDIMKYGVVKSFRRRNLSRAAKLLYSAFPESLQAGIRRLGLARIEPVNSQAFLKLLQQRFAQIVTDEDFYLWFSAEGSAAKGFTS